MDRDIMDQMNKDLMDRLHVQHEEYMAQVRKRHVENMKMMRRVWITTYICSVVLIACTFFVTSSYWELKLKQAQLASHCTKQGTN